MNDSQSSHSDSDGPSHQFTSNPHLDRTVEAPQNADRDDGTHTESHDECIDSYFDLEALSPSDDPKSLGRLGKYELHQLIGRGAMGVVFQGFDEQLQRAVAIKVLNRGLAMNPTARRRFIREARAAASIRHDNVVTIYAVEEHKCGPFLVMELVDGTTLRQRIKDSDRIPIVDIVSMSAQIAAGLAAAHAQGVIHRDIKPGNIMLESGLNRIKIADFGLARMMIDNVDLTSEGVVIGTPAYMAPEQVRSDKIDARADLFSLGCVIHSMFACRSPFHGRTSYEIMRKITDSVPKPLLEIDSAVPPFMDDLVTRLLQKDPRERIQSAAEVTSLLNEHLTVINQTATDELSNVLKRPVSGIGRNRLASKHRWIFATMAVAAICAIVYFVIVNNRRDPDPVPAELTVAQSQDADYRTIAAALEHAGPGTKITILDGERYDGPLVFDDGDRLRNVAIESRHAATISAGDTHRAVVQVSGVAGIELRGLQIESKGNQIGIEVTGQCPGLSVDGLKIRHGPGAKFAAIYLHRGAAGTESQPIKFNNLDIRCGNVAIVLGEDNSSANAALVSHVQLTNSRIQGYGNGQGVLLVMISAVSGIEVRNNVFCHGRTGLNFVLPKKEAAKRVRILRNTFYDLSYFLAYQNENSPREQDIKVHDNNIAKTNDLLLPPGGIAILPEGLTGNRWEKSDTVHKEYAAAVATLVNSIRFKSLDENHKDYLKQLSE